MSAASAGAAQTGFVCGRCGVQFTLRRNLRRHEKACVLRCRHCRAKFATVARCEGHEARCDGIKQKKTLRCGVCLRTFTRAGPYAVHTKACVAKSNAPRPFRCRFCGARFRTLTLMWRHLERAHAPKDKG